ncbi:hypothetical protein [Mesorhizobium sp. B2-4-6]|uniref:hypothetical protein n=1 Tax=Mesorhizobium sp. B2-4-6 TaxID=2589943 RepID=UPI00112BE088|nr:hypothetical protein [Mesorhizobium sp. B2-4-6]TPL51625.1 hypothetical protein FJ957_08595 [Mesorhizobium sp. B2-4-6]
MSNVDLTDIHEFVNWIKLVFAFVLSFSFFIWVDLVDRHLSYLGLSWSQYLYNQFVTRGPNIAYMQYHSSLLNMERSASKERNALASTSRQDGDSLVVVSVKNGRVHIKVGSGMMCLTEEQWRTMRVYLPLLVDQFPPSDGLGNFKQQRVWAAKMADIASSVIWISVIGCCGGAVAGALVGLFDWYGGSVTDEYASWLNVFLQNYVGKSSQDIDVFNMVSQSAIFSAKVGICFGLVFAALVCIFKVRHFAISFGALFGLLIGAATHLAVSPYGGVAPIEQLVGYSVFYGAVLGSFIRWGIYRWPEFAIGANWLSRLAVGVPLKRSKPKMKSARPSPIKQVLTIIKQADRAQTLPWNPGKRPRHHSSSD